MYNFIRIVKGTKIDKEDEIEMLKANPTQIFANTNMFHRLALGLEMG